MDFWEGFKREALEKNTSIFLCGGGLHSLFLSTTKICSYIYMVLFCLRKQTAYSGYANISSKYLTLFICDWLFENFGCGLKEGFSLGWVEIGEWGGGHSVK